MNTNYALEDIIISNKPDSALSQAHMEDLMTRIDSSARLSAPDHSVVPITANNSRRKRIILSTSAAAALALGVGVATSILPNAQSPAQASPLHGVSIALDPKMAQQLEANCSNAPMEDAAPDHSRVLTLKHAEDRGTFTVGWLESANGEKFTCLDYLSTAYGSATILIPYIAHSSNDAGYTVGANSVYVEPQQGELVKE